MQGTNKSAERKNLGGDEEEMETEQENIKSGFKDANDLVNVGAEKMPTKKDAD